MCCLRARSNPREEGNSSGTVRGGVKMERREGTGRCEKEESRLPLRIDYQSGWNKNTEVSLRSGEF